jgi:hypothetical protein
MPSQHNRKGRSQKGPPFAQLPHWMLDSPAYGSLTPAARAVHVTLIRRYSGFNNGTIALSARDAARLCKINKDTAGRSFKELIEEGFIEAVTPGGFSRKDPHATEWRLTHQRCDKTGELPSKAFMRRRDEKQNAVPKQGQLGPKPRPEQSPE